MSKHILVVDDDTLMRRSLSLSLEQAGYRATTAASAEDALALVRQDCPDLILLDIGLPGMDGLAALKQLQQTHNIPVIFVTARRRELDAILALEMGGDDFITKPFNTDVLLAHIKAVLRRSQESSSVTTTTPPPVTVGDLTIDPAAYTVSCHGRFLSLPAKEFQLLYTLALEASHVVPIEQLLSRVWGAEFSGEPQVVYVHIRWLREKLEENPNHPRRILTVRGVGYKLVPQED